MNSTEEGGGMKKSNHKPRALFLKLFIAFLLTFVALGIFIFPERLSYATENMTKLDIKQFISHPLAHFSRSKLFLQGKRHLILLWTPYFSVVDYLPPTKQLLCPINNCDVTSNRHLINKSSAVVMHWRNINPNDLPKCPFLEQPSPNCPFMVLFNKESPSHTSAETLRKMDDKIHWTVTYRRDSDIKAPYGNVLPRGETVDMPEISLNRSSVCWLVSNCHTASNREKYVNALRKYIPVEVYGNCGDHSCPHQKSLDCYKWLSPHCRFYLSFENSICKDYSTEKLYFAMMSGMLPVVMGGDDYAEHLPPHSFINVKDYSSPKKLAIYLQELNVNDSKYLSYFEWRRKYYVQDASYTWLCDLCEKLNTFDRSEVMPHKSVSDWWYKPPCNIVH